MDPKFLYTLGEKQNGTFFMYDQTTCKKGANEVVSFLQYYIENVLGPDIKILYLFSNNCYAQNKNHALVRYLATLCFTEKFDVIMNRFPEPGHSFLPGERFFGIIIGEDKFVMADIITNVSSMSGTRVQFNYPLRILKIFSL